MTDDWSTLTCFAIPIAHVRDKGKKKPFLVPNDFHVLLFTLLLYYGTIQIAKINIM